MPQAFNHKSTDMTPKVPTADWLVTQYALGRLPRAAALVAQTYLDMNPAARLTSQRIEQVGGWSIEQGMAAALSEGVTASAVLDRATAHDPAADTPNAPHEAGSTTSMPDLPRSLAAVIRQPVSKLRWRWRGLGAYEYRLRDYEDQGIIARLLRIDPGRSVPRHTHKGLEATLVLNGAYAVAAGRFGAGDLELANDDVDHRPVAEPGDTCLCLAVSEAPLKLTGRIGRLFQPLL